MLKNKNRLSEYFASDDDDSGAGEESFNFDFPHPQRSTGSRSLVKTPSKRFLKQQQKPFEDGSYSRDMDLVDSSTGKRMNTMYLKLHPSV